MNVLLLRGLTREKSHWGNFLPKLKRNFPNSVVFCLDLPGTGSENKRSSPRSVAGITDDLRARWRENFSKAKLEDWVCVGHSLGGMVALDWQYRYPKDFTGVVTLNTTSRGFSPFYQRAQPGALQYFVRIALERKLKERERKILNLVSNDHQNDEKIISEWVGFATERPIERFTPVNQLIAAMSFKAREAKVPLFFLASSADRLADYRCSVELQRGLGGEFRLHESAGHDMAIDDPDWVVDQLTDFAVQLKKRAKA